MSVRKFARKELHSDRDTPSIQFHLERSNLELLNAIKDDHIVPIVKSYSKGNKFNIVFPCAETNLHDYLRDPKYGADEINRGTLEHRPMWKQFHGLTGALHHILHPNPETHDENSQKGRPLFGYHFDLKPRNVLVFQRGVLKISDFGQAKFVNPKPDISRVTNPGGTEEYAPPEEDTTVRDSVYDIWSLGCILVEILIFSLRGYDGVKDFDEQRLTRSGLQSHISDRKYWWRENPSAIPIVKREVIESLDFLPRLINSAPSRDFLHRIIALAKKMLTVNVHERINSSDALTMLSTSIDYFQPGKAVNPRAQVQAREGEVELGHQEMRSLQHLHARQPEGSWQIAQVQVFEGQNDRLRVVTTMNGTMIPQTASRATQEIVPRYAFRKGHHENSSDWDICFRPTRDSIPSLGEIEFQFLDLSEARLFHTLLQGQTLRSSFQLQDVTLKERRALGRSVVNKAQLIYDAAKNIINEQEAGVGFSRSGKLEFVNQESGPFTLQLWREVKKSHVPVSQNLIVPRHFTQR